MSESPEEIIDEIFREHVGICKRCFKKSEPTKEVNSTGSAGAPCGEDCGTLSARLEKYPIKPKELNIRAGRLIDLIRSSGHDINKQKFLESVDSLSEIDEAPRVVFVESIRVATGNVSKSELREKYDLEKETKQESRSLLKKLPSSHISQEELEQADEDLLAGINRVVDSDRPGSEVYYLSDPSRIPEEYQGRSTQTEPKSVLRVVIRTNEDWFWNAGRKSVQNWLSELDDKLEKVAAECLYDRIQRKQSYVIGETPPVNEKFRQTSIWPVYKDYGERIMGFLRNAEKPQSTSEIAEQIGISESTARTLLEVLRNAEKVNRAKWTAVNEPGE